MNTQEYISSGIVESYVLGLADAEERAAFEEMCAAHAEVRAARDAFESFLELQASSGVVVPPEYVLDKILAQLQMESRDNIAPVVALTSDAENRKTRPSGGLSRYLAAASVALLVISTALNFYLFRQYKNYSERYAALLESQERVAFENNQVRQTLAAYKKDLATVQNPNMVRIDLQGANVPTSPKPASQVVVYWDKRTKEVFLGAVNLPKPTTDKQYQLWAIVNGTPVDAGVFDLKDEATLNRLTSVRNAPQAFAITLEKAGGSATPTMTQMYVLGTVKT